MLVVCLAWVAAPARGVASEFEVTWLSPDECPSTQSLLDRVERLLGRPLDRAAEPTLVVVARADRAADEGWEAVVLSTRTTVVWERRVRATSCDELVNAAALVLSLALPAQRPSVVVAAASVSRGPVNEGWLGAMAKVDVGILPRPSPRFEVIGAWVRKPLRLEVRLGSGVGQSILGNLEATPGFAPTRSFLEEPARVPSPRLRGSWGCAQASMRVPCAEPE